MNTQITLKSGPFWFLPNAKVHLSDFSPGPIDVDITQLAPAEQEMLFNGIRSGRLASSRPIEELMQPQSIPVPVQAMAHVDEETLEEVQGLESRPGLDKEVKQLLTKTINTIKKTIGLTDDIRMLRVMKEQELSGKKRKAVLSLLDSRLNYIINTVQTNIKVQTTNNAPIRVDQLDKLAANMEVIESDTEDIKIQV